MRLTNDFGLRLARSAETAPIGHPIPISKSVVYLPCRSAVYRPSELQALAKVELGSGERRILATLNVLEEEG
jgi:hypothetical protein